MTADSLETALQPAAKTVSLPRMGRALELSLTEAPDSRVWWIDPNLMVVWSTRPLPVGVPLAAKVDLVGGGTAALTLTVPEGQPPMRAENGAVCLVRYAPADSAAARTLSTALLRLNPRAFKADYVPPRLPRSTPTPPKVAPPVWSREKAMLAVAGGVAFLSALSFFLV